jgi:hypothetical protein
VRSGDEVRRNYGNKLACIGDEDTIGTALALVARALRGAERGRKIYTTLLSPDYRNNIPLAQLSGLTCSKQPCRGVTTLGRD